MDFNAFIDAVTDVIADKVAERLKDSSQSWPNIKTPGNLFELKVYPPEELTSALDEEEREEREPAKVEIVSHDWDARRVQLGKIDVRTLRKMLSTAGAGPLEEYSTYSKAQILDKAIDYEKLIGHSLEEEIEQRSDLPDDTDISEEEPEDDETTVELTRESALELELPKLREIAAENGHTEDEWEGYDVEAVVALIFGDEIPVKEEPKNESDDEDEGYTEEEIRKMSLGELKSLVKEVKEQLDIEIEFDRSIERDDLADKIIEALS